MKKLILGVLLAILAVNSAFPITIHEHMTEGTNGGGHEKLWQKADSLRQQGLPRSALEITRQLYNEAREEKNPSLLLRALLFQIVLRSEFEEDYQYHMINELNEEIKRADMPAFPVLHSIIGTLYWNYYQQNRFIILDRTPGAVTGEDFRTWDLRKLVETTARHYILSLRDTDELKKIPINIFDEIILKGENSRRFRPTLYDFLAHRALEFFTSGEAGLTRPADRFEIGSEDFFELPEKFANLVIPVDEPLSFEAQSLEIYRVLTGLHLNRKDPAPLVDATLRRLEYVRSKAALPERDSLYLAALNKLLERYENEPVSVDIRLAIATELQNRGVVHNVHDPFCPNRIKLKQALDICNQTIALFPDEPSTENVRILRDRLLFPTLGFAVTNTTVPRKPFTAQVTYRNLDTVWLRLVATDPDEDRKLRYRVQHERTNPTLQLLKAYLAQPVHNEWSQWLPNDGYLHTHNADILIPALRPGYYILLASMTRDFKPDSTMMAFAPVWVTNLSFVSNRRETNLEEILVLHRQTGRPMENVDVILYRQEWDAGRREQKRLHWKTLETNRNGIVRVEINEPNMRSLSYTFELRSGNDRFAPDSWFGLQVQPRMPVQTSTRTFFFTDRSVYRPGQTVFFKGIVVQSEGEKHQAKSAENVEVRFFDPNGQEVASATKTTNEFGSFAGSFVIPTGRLTGAMAIVTINGSTSIQVEEYKRPRFEVVFQPVTELYKLGESIETVIEARAFAGFPVGGASVQYRVVRRTRFPFVPFWRRWIIPHTEETEIVSGTGVTASDGTFPVVFEALPDATVRSLEDAVFDFEISVSVTDINGETRFTSTFVPVGARALLLSVDTPHDVNRNDLDTILIRTTNLNGKPVPAQGSIEIVRLKPPMRVYRERLYARPDRFPVNLKDFRKHFPLDLYENEDDPATWQTELLVLKQPFNTANDSALALPQPELLLPGQYRIRLTATDPFGGKVETDHFFTLYAPETKDVPLNRLFWTKLLTPEVPQGGTAQLLVASAATRTRMMIETIVEQRVVNRRFITLNRRQQRIEIPLNKEWKGEIALNIVSVRHNRSFTAQHTISRANPADRIDIRFETFRNRLLPGSNEEWRITLQDAAGLPVAGELAVAMYDASLDAILPHQWVMNLFRGMPMPPLWNSNQSFALSDVRFYQRIDLPARFPFVQTFDRLKWLDEGILFQGWNLYRKDMRQTGITAKMSDDTEMMAAAQETLPGDTPPTPAIEEIQPRRNLRETAFFYPQLQANEKGELLIAFTVPEALTRWKILGLAHTTAMHTGTITKTLETAKKLMVVPNQPRFIREGDQIDFPVKVVNVSGEPLSGEIELRLLDAYTMQPADSLFYNKSSRKSFQVEAGGSINISWPLTVPLVSPHAIVFRVTASANGHSDGEEFMIPVLTNRVLVTETLPITVRGAQTREFRFDKLLRSNQYPTLNHHRLTLEFVANPVWIAVKAMPYLAEPTFRSSDQLFNRVYINSIGRHIVKQQPQIEHIFESWRTITPSALLSNLEKNQDLKSVVLDETPWVVQGRSESENKQRVAAFFDANRMANELRQATQELKAMQLPDGSFPWFAGMPASRNITQTIVAGYGKLLHIGALDPEKHPDTDVMLREAIIWLDEQIVNDHRRLTETNRPEGAEPAISNLAIQYLYARSFFLNRYPVPEAAVGAWDYFVGQAALQWNRRPLMLQGMMALTLHRAGMQREAQAVVRSLRERSLRTLEMGMYWRDLGPGWFWYEAPIETQALLIEAFNEITGDTEAVDEMKTWLLRQKQTQSWETQRATANAVYALLQRGADWTARNQKVVITVGDETIDTAQREELIPEAGTGYFRTSWFTQEVKPEKGIVTVEKTGEGISWGALYWQYFEQLDKITPHETPLRISKSLYREVQSATGPVLQTVTGQTPLSVGDKVISRIVIRVDRDLEFVHLKDLRAAGFEPLNVLSGYNWRDGLGYYESVRDASANFFFERLPRGTYVFEYEVVATQRGDFSGGIASIQCLYAPEFTSHSQGIRVVVE